MTRDEWIRFVRGRVMRIVGLQAQVTSFAECAQASVFVAILERMHEVWP
jgi:hypothetical protein